MTSDLIASNLPSSVDRAAALRGEQRARALWRLTLGADAELALPTSTILEPTSVDALAWAGVQLGRETNAQAQGVEFASVPDAWQSALAWTGMPLVRADATDQAVRWGEALSEADIDAPTLVYGRLLLPPPARYAALSSVALKPVRRFITERFGIRLQVGAQVACWRWARAALLISRSDVHLGGFFHGPDAGSRVAIALDPGASQRLAW